MQRARRAESWQRRVTTRALAVLKDFVCGWEKCEMERMELERGVRVVKAQWAEGSRNIRASVVPARRWSLG